MTLKFFYFLLFFSLSLIGISKEMEGREGSEEIPIQIPIHKVKTTIPPTTPKKSAASNEGNPVTIPLTYNNY